MTFMPSDDTKSDGPFRWQAIQAKLKSNFYEPDLEAAQALFASVAAHRLKDYPPAWNMLIAPSGSMKTALLDTLQDLPSVHTIDDVTENTFISGKLETGGVKQKAAKSLTPASLLNRIGDEGILVVPDFSTVLAMNKNKQPVILSQLRRIYDGSFAREFGTAENLQDRKWKGRITFLAGVTPEFDKYHSVFQSLGERFLRTRWPRVGGVEAALSAMRQQTSDSIEVRSLVHQLLLPILGAKAIASPQIQEKDLIRIANLGELVVRARTSTKRERSTHELEDVPDPEGNTRFPQQLAQIGRGWAVLMGNAIVTEIEMSLIARVAFDCIPPRRCDILRALMDDKNPYALGLPHSVVERGIEDLQVLELVTKPIGERKAALSCLAIQLLDGAKINELGLRLFPPIPISEWEGNNEFSDM